MFGSVCCPFFFGVPSLCIGGSCVSVVLLLSWLVGRGNGHGETEMAVIEAVCA